VTDEKNQVQKDFEKYWRKVKRQAERTNENFRPGKSGLAFGYPQFKRWENYWLPRVSGTDGMRPDGAWLAQTMLAAKTGTAAAQNAGDWQPIGPFNAPNMNGNGWTGIGRVNCVAFHPTNTNIIWAGTPAGGLWKSTDGGQSWTTNTDDLPHLGIASIAIDPQHPDTMYVATGEMALVDYIALQMVAIHGHCAHQRPIFWGGALTERVAEARAGMTCVLL
jgi:hypothetical protein